MTEISDSLKKYSTPSLRRNILSRDGKRWQLFGKGVKGEQAKVILDELYGEEQPNDKPEPTPK